MQDHERRRILNHLTELSASLVAGGIRRDQPDLVLIGRVLMLLVDRVGEPAADELIRKFIVDLKETDGLNREVDELLKSLGLDGLGKI